MTIGDSEKDLVNELRRVLSGVLPQTLGYAVQVEIFENSRKKRRDASLASWRPARGEIRIKFDGLDNVTAARYTSERTVPEGQSDRFSTPQVESRLESNESIGGQDPGTNGRRTDLIKSLDQAERRPGFGFVSLTRFRDHYLPEQPLEWAKSPEDRDLAIRSAIHDGVVLTGKVPNPKAPAFPVTAIRLNRTLPDVAAVLGEVPVDSTGFEPISIRGDSLSDTVSSDRR